MLGLPGLNDLTVSPDVVPFLEDPGPIENQAGRVSHNFAQQPQMCSATLSYLCRHTLKTSQFALSQI